MNQTKPMQVQYTIVDGEHEYLDSFVFNAKSGNEREQAFRELAEFYVYDEEDKQEIIASLQSEGIAMIGGRAIKKIFVQEFEPITVIVRGGVIQDIQHIPDGITIRVRDYDIDNLTEEELLKETEPDDEGNPCVVAIWNNQ